LNSVESVFGTDAGDPSVFETVNLILSLTGIGIRLRSLDREFSKDSHATQLLLQGVNPKIVSKRLGHSTVGITLDI
jgi:hypothetical protein